MSEKASSGAASSGLGRSAFRGLLWGVLVAVLVLLVLVTYRTRQREEAPPKLSSLPGFSFTDQGGDTVRLDDLLGEAWVADFIFTRCPGPCPLMSKKMQQLGPLLPEGVKRVSFSVDPDHDTPEVLTAYAERYGVQGGGAGGDWIFLTGDREGLWELSHDGFKMGVDAAEGDLPQQQGPIIHSTRFVLVDGEGVVRGYYDPFDRDELDRLLRELRAVRRDG